MFWCLDRGGFVFCETGEDRNIFGYGLGWKEQEFRRENWRCGCGSWCVGEFTLIRLDVGIVDLLLIYWR